MHARRSFGDRLDILHALGGFEQGVDQDRPLQAVAGFELRQQLVEIMNVPRAFDLRQHHHVELVADGGDDLVDVVEHPRRIQGIDPRPQARRAEIIGERHGDEAGARRGLGLDRHGVFEIAEHDIDLAREVADLGAHLFVVGRDEINHPLDLDRQFAVGRRRADGERLVKFAWRFHDGAPNGCCNAA